MHDQPPNAAVLAAMGTYFIFVFIIGLAALAFTIYLYWRIAVKAGYNGWVSLLMLVPPVNIVIAIMFAFSEWPLERERDALRAGVTPPPPTGWQPPAPALK